MDASALAKLGRFGRFDPFEEVRLDPATSFIDST